MLIITKGKILKMRMVLSRYPKQMVLILSHWLPIPTGFCLSPLINRYLDLCKKCKERRLITIEMVTLDRSKKKRKKRRKWKWKKFPRLSHQSSKTTDKTKKPTTAALMRVVRTASMSKELMMITMMKSWTLRAVTWTQRTMKSTHWWLLPNRMMKKMKSSEPEAAFSHPWKFQSRALFSPWQSEPERKLFSRLALTTTWTKNEILFCEIKWIDTRACMVAD